MSTSEPLSRTSRKQPCRYLKEQQVCFILFYDIILLNILLLE